MHTNFQIEQKSNGNILYLNLFGDFNESSAWELIKTIYRQFNANEKLIINCDEIKSLSEKGKEILHNNLHSEHKLKVFFEGAKAHSVVPAGFNIHKKEKEHVCRGNCKNCKCRSLKSA